jgi:glycosyltransferase involved in cell wall biosynthesis
MTESAQRFRLAHLVSHPIQYFAPLYRELSRRPEIEFTVYFYSDTTIGTFADPGFGRRIAWDVDLLSGYRSKFAPSSRGLQLDRARWHPHLDIIRELIREQYDAVWVHGYAHIANWLAAAVAMATNARVMVRDDQTLLRPRPRRRSLAKHLVLRPLFRNSDCLYIGEENRRHFETHGARAERLFLAPYCVDNDRFTAVSDGLAAHRKAIRASWGLDQAPVVLFAGKLIDEKQPLRLLDTFSRVARELPCWLLVAGDGPLALTFDSKVEALGTKRVVRTGFLNQSELARAYVAADVLVLPSSSETWGLVVNEAMNFGLPLVVSDRVGCAADLVQHGSNGFVVAHDDAFGFESALRELIQDGSKRMAFGARSRQIIKRYSVSRCADGIIRACIGAPEAARPLVGATR